METLLRLDETFGGKKNKTCKRKIEDVLNTETPVNRVVKLGEAIRGIK